MVVFVPQIIPIDAFLLPEFGTETGLRKCVAAEGYFAVVTNHNQIGVREPSSGHGLHDGQISNSAVSSSSTPRRRCGTGPLRPGGHGGPDHTSLSAILV